MRFEANPFDNSLEMSRLPNVIADFLVDALVTKKGATNYMPWEMDISDPHMEDMDSIGNKKFTISKLHIAPGIKGSRSFHCYVGRTEFHLAGRAASRIEEMLLLAA